MQQEVLKEYKKMKHVSGDPSSVISVLCVLAAAGGLTVCAFVLCVLCTGQPKLPRGEAALRVFAQQVGPHQAADSRF